MIFTMHRKYSVFLCDGRCDMSNKVAGIRLGAAGAGGGWVRQHVRYLNCLYHEAVRCAILTLTPPVGWMQGC